MLKADRRRFKRNQGLTMIEMVVVFAGLIILIGLLAPTLKKVRDTGKRVKCLSNLKQLGVAMDMYIQDDRQGRFPGWSGNCNLVENLPNLLNAYLGQEDTDALTSGELSQFRCPANQYTGNLSQRQDAYGNQVDYELNCNLRGQSVVAEVGNDAIAVILADFPAYPASASNQVHLTGTNLLFVDGHAQWYSRSKLNSAWPNETQYPGTAYYNWGTQ